MHIIINDKTKYNYNIILYTVLIETVVVFERLSLKKNQY